MQIIITDSVKNVNRIIRRRNYEIAPSHGMEAMTSVNLAWQIIIEKLSAKGLVAPKLIQDNTAASIVLEALIANPGILPFIPEESICLETAKEVLNNMNLLRANTANKVADARVNDLNQLILVYEKKLEEENLYDEIRVLKEALKILRENGCQPDKATEYLQCFFSQPSVLENSFISELSGGCPAEYPKPASDGSEQCKFVTCFGIINETDYVARTIVENDIPLGDVEIFCDPGVYAPYLEESFAKRSLKNNFICGVSAARFNTVQLLKSLIAWYKGGCKYEDLFNVFHNPVFVFDVNGTKEHAGEEYLYGISYKIGWGAERYLNVEQPLYDKIHGKTETAKRNTFRTVLLPEFGELAQKLDKASSPVEVLVALLDFKDAHTSSGIENKYMSGPLSRLRKNMKSFNISFSDKTDVLEYVENEISALTYSESECYDAAVIDCLSAPKVTNRKHIFVLGLSAKEFKVETAESPVLGDALRKELFGCPPCGNVTLTEDALDRVEKLYTDTFAMVSPGSVLTLIASSADVLRDSSGVATSAFFEKLKNEKGGAVNNQTQYYDITRSGIQVNRVSAWSGFASSWTVSNLPKTFSKSRLDTLLACPLKYHYENELWINQEEYTNYDPGKWLSANEKGTFIHRILELYGEKVLKDNFAVSNVFDPTCLDFVAAVDCAASEAQSGNAAPSEAVRDAEIEECKQMTAMYLEVLHKDLHDNGWTVVACEEDIDPSVFTYTFDVCGEKFSFGFSGTIDRIDKKILDDGTEVYRIEDYKTGKKSDEKNTTQHLIYAEYVRNKYGNVESFDYRFLKSLYEGNFEVKEDDWTTTFPEAKLSSEIISTANISKKEEFSQQELIYKVFKDHDYTCRVYSEVQKTDTCKYCRYKDICLYGISGKEL